MRKSVSAGLRAALLCSSAFAAPFCATLFAPAHAQTANAASYSIRAQGLGSALASFADKAGLKLLFPSHLAAGRSSAGLNGSFTREQALSALLAGTGLSYSFTSASTVTIFDPRGEAGASLDGDAIQLETIDVTTQGAGSRAAADLPYETAGSVSYISRENIERFRGAAPGDMLRGTPGVLTGATNEKGAIDVNIRGMQGMDRVPVILDGTRQSQTIYEGYAGVASRSYIDPDMIGGVTIEKGPSAAPDAVGATGGVARMRTIDADDILLDGKNYGARLRAGVSSNTTSPPVAGTRGGLDYYLLDRNYLPAAVPTEWGAGNFDRPSFFDPKSFNGSAATAVRNENIEVVAAYAHRRQGNYFAGTEGDGGHVVLTPQSNGRIRATAGGLYPYRLGEEVLSSDYENTSWLLKSKFIFDGGHTVDLSYMNFESIYTEMPWPGLTGLSGGQYQNIPSLAQVDTWKMGYEYNPLDSSLVDLKMNAWMTDTDFSQNFLLRMTVGPYAETAFEVDSRRMGIDADNTSRFSGVFGDLTVRYGASFTYEDLDQKGFATVYALGSTAEEQHRSGNREETSAFVSSEWRPHDWLKFDAALRYTYTRTVDDCIGINLTSDDCYGRRNDGGFAPIIAGTVEPWDGVQFYARYAEAIRVASLFETTAGVSFSASNFDLKPEHARNWEFGFNFMRDNLVTSGDAARFKLAYFDNDITDYLTRRAGGTGEPIYVLTNLDHARFTGFEVSAEYDSGRFFSTLGYTHYLETEFCGYATATLYQCGEEATGNSFSNLHLPPRDSVNLTAGMRFFDEALTLGGRLTFMGDRVIEGSNSPSDPAIWDPYTLVDVFATYKPSKNVQLDIGVDNVTDVFYISPLSILSKPGPGRTFRINMTMTF